MQADVDASSAAPTTGHYARLDREIDAFNLRWEIGIHRILAVLIVAAAVMIAAISPWIGSDLAVPEIGLCLVAIGYFAASSLVLRRMDIRRLGHMRWVSVTAEATFGTLAIAITAVVKGPEWAITSPTILIYALSIVSCAIRIRPKLTAYCALVASVEYLLLYYLYLGPQLDGTGSGTVLAWAAWERAFWLVLIGGTATYATMHVRKTALAGSAQAMRRAWVEQEMSRFMPAEASSVALSGMARLGFVDRRRVTVMFCDLRDFTGLCEREQPDDVIALLNEFYARACTAINRRGGQVNKFLGDGLLALFDEERVRDHADAALDAGRELVDIAGELRRRGGIWEQLSIAVGVDSGVVVIGTVGGEDRLELTAIGSPVNRAARLQSVARFAPRRVVISGSCAALLLRTPIRSLGTVTIKGVDEPVAIFTPAGDLPRERLVATHVSTIPEAVVGTPS